MLQRLHNFLERALEKSKTKDPGRNSIWTLLVDGGSYLANQNTVIVLN